MADSKITALDALTDPQTTDIIPVVDFVAKVLGNFLDEELA